MVPPNWQHPKQEKPNYRTGQMEESYHPLRNRPYIQALTEWLKEHEAWERGELAAQGLSGGEVRRLVRALFEDTDYRAQMLQRMGL